MRHDAGPGTTPRPARTEDRTLPTPGLPLPLRNALATLAIDALESDAARAAVHWLAAPGTGPTSPAADRLVAVHLIDPGGQALLDVHAAHRSAAAAHARRALAATTAYRRAARPAGPVARAVQQAVALWNAGLFFEVHEVLEPVWKDAGGATRQALQGIIQIAVAFHHLAHGNVRGARSLMREGRERLGAASAGTLPLVDCAKLLAATAPWENRLASGTASGDPPPPLPTRDASTE